MPRAFAATDIRREAPRVPLGGPGGTGDVKPGIPTLLDSREIALSQPGEGGGTGRRLALAHWITDPGNPLTSRVMVNRLWQHHFGRGLVGTPNDFGNLGERPSHPDLLDWLATRFREGGWRMKPVHRLIMTSAAYRQTARVEPGERAAGRDPGNRLLWRHSPRRLDAEQIRDAMLAVSGELDLTAGGKSVDGETPRRSIYVKKIRNTPDELLKGFDAPLGFESTARRAATTTATQSLPLVNGDDGPGSGPRPWPGDWWDRAGRCARGTSAKPTASPLAGEAVSREVREAMEFIAAQRGRIAAEGEGAAAGSALPEESRSGSPDKSSADPPEGLIDFCHALLTSNEFLYLH